MSNLDPNWAAHAVTDPTTSAAQLAQIAAEYPQLHAAIVAHPNVYPELRDWITRYSAQLSRNLGLPSSLDTVAPAARPATAPPVSPESSTIPAQSTELSPTSLSPAERSSDEPSPANPFGVPGTVDPWGRPGTGNSLEQGGFDQSGYSAVPGQPGYPGAYGRAGYPGISAPAGYSTVSGQGGYPTDPNGGMSQQGFTPARPPRRGRLGIIIAAVAAAVLVIGGGATAWGVTASRGHSNKVASSTTHTSAPPHSQSSPSPSSPSAPAPSDPSGQSASPSSPPDTSGDLAVGQCLALMSADSQLSSQMHDFDVNVTGSAATTALQTLQQAVDDFNNVANQVTAPQLSSSVHDVSGDLNKMVSLLEAAVTANNKGEYSAANSDIDQYNAMVDTTNADSDNLKTTCEALVTTGGGSDGSSSGGNTDGTNGTGA